MVFYDFAPLTGVVACSMSVSAPLAAATGVGSGPGGAGQAGWRGASAYRGGRLPGGGLVSPALQADRHTTPGAQSGPGPQ